jgi:hypothetical protein
MEANPRTDPRNALAERLRRLDDVLQQLSKDDLGHFIITGVGF